MATTVRLPIDLRNPQLNANQGNCFTNVLNLTAYELSAYQFLNNQTGNIFGLVPIPANMAATPNAGIILTFTPGSSTSTGSFRANVSTARVANAASFNPGTLTAETLISTAGPGVAHQRTDVTFPAAGNIGVTPVANDWFIVQINRDGANAGDTFEADLFLIGAFLRIDIL